MPKKDELYDVHTSLDDDKNDGWVWLKDPVLESMEGKRVVVRITAKTGRSVFCEALYANSRYLEKWSAIWRITNYPIPAMDSNLAFISPWYRSRLGIDPLPQHLQMEYREGLRPLAWQLRACLDHPLPSLRVITALGLVGLAVSVGLAFGVAFNQLGIFPISK